MAAGDEVVDSYVAEVLMRSNDESELSDIKRAACEARGRNAVRDRIVYYIRECPAKECCSDGAWNKKQALVVRRTRWGTCTMQEASHEFQSAFVIRRRG